MDDSFGDGFSGVSVHLSREGSKIFLNLVFVGAGNAAFDSQDIIDIVQLMWRLVARGHGFLAGLEILFWYLILEALPLVVAIGDVVHILDSDCLLALCPLSHFLGFSNIIK